MPGCGSRKHFVAVLFVSSASREPASDARPEAAPKPGRTCGRQRAGGGTVVRTTATHSSSGSSPLISGASAVVTGASFPAARSALASSGTDSSASTAWPTRSGSLRRARPPRAARPRGGCVTGAPAPSRRGRRFPRARSSTRVARLALAHRQTSAKMWPAAAPAAFSPCASVAPDASAAAFFAAPASSTPIGSFDSSHTTPARMKTRRSRSRAPPRGGRYQAGAVGHHLPRVRRPADAGGAVVPKRR